MTSNRLFFKWMKEDLKKRVSSLAIVSLLSFFGFLVTWLLLTSMSVREWKSENWTAMDIVQLKGEFYSSFLKYVSSPLIIFSLAMLGVLVGVSGFAYLFSKKKTDFYHSLPIKRDFLYGAIVLDSMIIVGLPYLVFSSLASLIVGAATGERGALILTIASWAGNMTAFLLLYATVVLAVMLTGNWLVSLLAVATFWIYGPMVYILRESYEKIFFRTILYNVHQDILPGWLSPLVFVLMKRIDQTKWINLGVGVLLLVVSGFLYRLRRSEVAGSAMSFTKTMAAIKLCIVIPSALLGALGFYVISDNTLIWAVFGLICGVVISHAVIEIIYHADFRKLFAHKMHMVMALIVSLLIFFSYKQDFLGHDRYIPKEGEFLGVNFVQSEILQNSIDSYRMWWDYKEDATVKEPSSLYTDKSVIEKLAKKAVDSLKLPQSEINDRIEFYYYLKNGKRVGRSYPVNKDDKELQEIIAKIKKSDELKKMKYPVLNMKTVDNVKALYCSLGDNDGLSYMILKPQNLQKLLETYQKELSNAIQAEQIDGGEDVIHLSFLSEIPERVSKEHPDAMSYPVYSSFKETLAVLKEMGIEPITQAPIEKITIEYHDGKQLDIVDKDQQKAIIEASKFVGLHSMYSDNRYHYYAGEDKESKNFTIYVTTRELNDRQQGWTYCFDKVVPYNSNEDEHQLSGYRSIYEREFLDGKVPEFVQNLVNN
jgi:hypothetical protein